MLASMLLAFVTTSGSLFLVGGGKTPPEVVTAFIARCGGPDSLIVVLPQAMEDPAKGTGSVSLLQEHDARNVELFGIAKPSGQDLEALRGKLGRAKGIWMPGGVQSRIVDRFGKGWLDENLRPLVKKGLNVFGTSAGAMVCSPTMITGPGKEPNTAETAPGLGLANWTIDTHFAQRNREGRLRHALASTGSKRGLGLNEREWVVIQDDEIVERHGNPTIIVLP